MQSSDLDFDKNYKIFMSTVFKLLGANSTVNNTIVDEVKRINKLEKDFFLVSIIIFVLISFLQTYV